MTSARKDMAVTATARSNVYGLLAGVFRAEPSSELLAQLRTPEFSGALEALGISLGGSFFVTSNDNLVEDLAVEFTRLFIGPGPHLSPNESVHIETESKQEPGFWGPETVKVKKFMEAAGLAIDDSFTGMPDHISAEFEFMQQLALKEAEAWAEPNQEFATNILKIEKRFLDEHLSQWIPRFCDKVIEMAEEPFYREFAEVTKGFIDFDGDSLQASIDGANVGDDD